VTPGLPDRPLTLERGGRILTTDRARIDVDAALALLRGTFWAGAMPRDTLARAIANSVSFGVLEADRLVAFARVVTDLATYAYWTDVVVAEDRRGSGIGQWLTESMLAHPGLQGLRRVALMTRDAQALYERLGFRVGSSGSTYMEIKPGPTGP